jgi:hypothetical protein
MGTRAAGTAAIALLVAASFLGTGRAEEPAVSDTAGPSPPLPPALTSVTDTPNDAGTSLDLLWEPSPTVDGTPEAVIEYNILRAESPGGEYQAVGMVAADRTSFSDGNTEPGKPYWYRIEAVGPGGKALSEAYGPGTSRMQWYDRGRTSVLALTVLTCVLVIVFIERAKRSTKPVFLRRLPVFDAIDEAIGRATEMGRKVLYIMGGLDVDDPQTVASMSVLARVSERAATYGARMDIPCIWPMAMSMARETVKESYLRVGRPDDFCEDDIYYLTTDQFGYVAGVDGIMMRDRPAANFYLGAFYAESLVFAETGYATGAIQIAGTAEVDQLPFFVVACDYTLIGEELYAAGASLSGDPIQLGSIKGQDMAKAIFFLLIVVGVVLKLAGVEIIDRWLMIAGG